MKLIGLCGYAQHGKDTFADILVGKGFQKMAFAAALKDMLYELNPAVGLDVYADHWRLQDAVDVDGWDTAKRNPEVRRLLQVFGTEVMRNRFGPDVWVDLAFQKMPAGGAYVVTDVRFSNEAAAIHRKGGYLARIVRKNPNGTDFDNGIGTSHPSEQHVSSLPADFQFDFVTGDIASMELSAGALLTAVGNRAQQPAYRGPHMPTTEELLDLFR